MTLIFFSTRFYRTKEGVKNNTSLILRIQFNSLPRKIPNQLYRTLLRSFGLYEEDGSKNPQY